MFDFGNRAPDFFNSRRSSEQNPGAERVNSGTKRTGHGSQITVERKKAGRTPFH